jgi:hypothetical protein
VDGGAGDDGEDEMRRHQGLARGWGRSPNVVGAAVDGALVRAAETLRGQIKELAFAPDGPL